MKRGFIILLILFCSGQSIAQGSFMLVQEGARWKEVWCNYWASTLNGVYFTDQIRIEGDTVFNGVYYKKLYIEEKVYKYAHLTAFPNDSLVSTSEYFFGGIRQDTGSVYIASAAYDTTMEEKLIFDFSAQPGDTITTWLNYAGYQNFLVDSIYYMQMADGSSRKIYTFQELVAGTPLPLYWIEGIGTNFGLLSSHYLYMNDESHYLRCFDQGNIKVFDMIPVYSSDCLAPPLQNCDTLVTGSISDAGATGITIFPNPATDQLAVEIYGAVQDELTIGLYNIYGQEIKGKQKLPIISDRYKFNLDVSDLSSGVYFIKTAGAFSGTHRFVKH